MTDNLPIYGGQAVIEGIMMRGKKAVAIAMRNPNQVIEIQTNRLSGIYESRVIKIPFLRGLVSLWDSLGLGIRALTISANLQTEEEEQLEGPALYITLFISLAIGIILFSLLPATAGQLTENLLGWNSFSGNMIEGILRLVILISYLRIIRFMPDIKRVYEYHGAEHKTINAFEAGAELTPESVSHFSLEHPRCGTSFLLTVVLLSILIFSFLGPMPLLTRLISRVLFIPVLAGIAYEYIRWTAKRINSPFIRLLIAPNLALQRLTTCEPNLDTIEVGIAAFNAMREAEEEYATL